MNCWVTLLNLLYWRNFNHDNSAVFAITSYSWIDFPVRPNHEIASVLLQLRPAPARNTCSSTMLHLVTQVFIKKEPNIAFAQSCWGVAQNERRLAFFPLPWPTVTLRIIWWWRFFVATYEKPTKVFSTVLPKVSIISSLWHLCRHFWLRFGGCCCRETIAAKLPLKRLMGIAAISTIDH